VGKVKRTTLQRSFETEIRNKKICEENEERFLKQLNILEARRAIMIAIFLLS
jgi:hypothetical protein